jgi:Arm DNA-binding domain
MSRKPIGLTDAKIKALVPPSSGQSEMSDSLIPSLRVRVGSSGVKTFILRKRVGGQLRNITIGRYSANFSLADARKKVRSLIIDIESGKGVAKPTDDRGRSLTGQGTFKYLQKQCSIISAVHREE